MRERTTWTRSAAQNKVADPYLMNQDHVSQQPAAEKYVIGDPSTFAEDVHPSKDTWEAEYANGQVKRNEIGMPEMRKDTFNHPEKTAADKALLLKKADLCIKTASLMLGKAASASMVEDQSVALMHLPDADLINTFNRLAQGQVAQQAMTAGQQCMAQGQKAQQALAAGDVQSAQACWAAMQDAVAQMGQQCKQALDAGDLQAAQQCMAEMQASQQQVAQVQAALMAAQGQKMAQDQQGQQGKKDEEPKAQSKEAQDQQGEQGKKDEEPKAQSKEAQDQQGQQQAEKKDQEQGQQKQAQQVQAEQIQAAVQQAVAQVMAQLMGQQAQQQAPVAVQQQAQQAPVAQQVDDAALADMLMVEPQLDGSLSEMGIEMEPAPMDVGEMGLAPEDDVLMTLFASDEQGEKKEQGEGQGQQKQAMSRTASTRTVGTRPTGGVSRVGGSPAASNGGDVNKLAALWPSAPDVSDAFR